MWQGSSKMQVVSQDNVQAICNAFVDCQSQPSCGLRQLPSLRTWNCKSKQQSLVGKGNSRSFPKTRKSTTTFTVTHTLHVLFILVMRFFISWSRILLKPRPICEKRNGAHRVDVGTRSACTHVFTSRGHSQLRLQTPAS